MINYVYLFYLSMFIIYYCSPYCRHVCICNKDMYNLFIHIYDILLFNLGYN